MASTTNALVENYSTVGYHGTSRESAALILSSNFSISSEDDHWLGRGSYFFETGISDGLEDAKSWGKVAAWDNEEKCNTYEFYSVIKATLEFERMWDLCSREGLELFEHARARFRKKGVKPGEAASGKRFDNSVIEYAATLMNFDGLRAWFYIKLDAKSRKLQVQSGIQNATVICARKPSDCISLDRVSVIAEGWVSR